MQGLFQDLGQMPIVQSLGGGGDEEKNHCNQYY